MSAPSPKAKTNRVYSGLSQAERVKERKEKLLEAGLELFGTIGLKSATVRSLCKTAGLTERYFYESFTDTEDLFCAVYNQQISAIGHYFSNELPQLQGTMEERVNAALDLYFKLVRNSRLVRVLYVEGLHGSPRVTETHYNFIRMTCQLSIQWMRADHPELNLPDDVFSCVAMGIVGACTALAVDWMQGNYSTPHDTMVRSCSLIVLGIMRQLYSHNTGAE